MESEINRGLSPIILLLVRSQGELVLRLTMVCYISKRVTI
jgi:hypothetical protein